MTWWVAVTHPSNELRAAARLAERGFEAWYPMRHVEIINRHTRRLKRRPTRAYPAFPSYVFVRVAGSHHDLRDIDGIRGVLCNNWRPMTVSDAVVDLVRARAADLVPVQEWQPYIGEPVRMISGPMEGHCGPVNFIRGESAAVLFDILGKQTPVLVPVRDLRRAA